MNDARPRIAVFCLTRGYPRLGSKWRYILLLLRNWSLNCAQIRLRESWDNVVFHEGNIGKVDQFFLRMLSFGRLDFIDVSNEFALPNSHVFTGANSNLGYALMCRFQYFTAISKLAAYDVVMRVDEDCFVLKPVSLASSTLDFGSVCISSETHEITNSTLPAVLQERFGAHALVNYNHVFPYTNVYVTRPELWIRPHIFAFTTSLGENPFSLENRWGDIPVLGFAVNHFNQDFKNVSLAIPMTYFHISHATLVTKDGFTSQPLSIRNLLRAFLQAFRTRES